ncbi:MAG: beta-lactamase family protein [Bacillus sp. (in: Bacteria)]|nr:beta-lactamase family protein [Bacillus sp. (in: firmicutes)]
MMKPKKKLLLFIAACLFPFLAVSFSPLQTEALPDSASKQEQLDDFIQEYVDKLVLPGLSIAISHKGELIYSQTFGDGLETESRFYIGSTTKPFTALAIMQLVEQRRIKLDNSVSVYLPDFTVSDDITVRHLLHHVSGMSEFNYIAKLPDHAIFTELIDDMNTMTLTYKPGSEFAYFNQNYSLLGAIIERVSGKTYPEYITEHILEPLQLNNTTLTGEVDLPGNMSFFGVPVKRTEPFKVYDLPAGYMTSTAEDVVAFLDSISLSRPELGISQVGVKEMLDGNSSYYGMGWIVTDVAGRPAVHH